MIVKVTYQDIIVVCIILFYYFFNFILTEFFFLTKESGPDVISLSSDSSNDDDVGDDIQSEKEGVEINQDGEEVEIVGESTTEITSKVLQRQSFPDVVSKKATLTCPFLEETTGNWFYCGIKMVSSSAPGLTSFPALVLHSVLYKTHIFSSWCNFKFTGLWNYTKL